ncbi:uncharacterized protein EI90DRAFT_3145249 [Cantharellus anzutake]|uniref:uncharacterized protein n=1 Tax=Cantharellus anzutake TaxID=1750568 RepID=UPI0019077362|nr:uncharacterized protein EI90DRAFT_3145249 [Cantharellus anzutake]KAF8333014.1 hypothetical protein EI90DRAFT_3145249 [Cantharellus anzutake]
MTQRTTDNALVYKSPHADVNVPEHNVYTHILPSPTHAPHPNRMFTRKMALQAEDQIALVDALTGERYTRAQLRRRTEALSTSLREMGLKKGSSVMIISPNSIEYPVVTLASLAAGLVPSFVNPAYTPSEILHQFNDSSASLVFVHSESLTVLLSALPTNFPVSERVIVMQHRNRIPGSILAQVPPLIFIDDLIYQGDRKKTGVENFDGELAKKTTAFLYYSSGTTGKSKGVELTHHNMSTAISICSINWGADDTSRDVMLAVIPWYHITGSLVTFLYSIHMGVKIIVLPRFTPSTFLGAIQRHRVIVMVVAPPLLLFFKNSKLVEDYDISSIRDILTGSAPASKELIEGTTNRLRGRGARDAAISQAYGLTETTAGTHILPRAFSLSKVHTVGRLQPNLQARLVDDNEVDVSPGERGELWIRGPLLMKSYLRNEAATRDTITPDGWLKTGDIAIVDSEGFFSIVDRKKELIKYKGFQALLLKHDMLEDAGVVGTWDEVGQTELPTAYVVPRNKSILTASQSSQAKFAFEIQEWVKSQVAHYKQLRGGVILVTEIPKSAAGKILRRNLRELAAKLPRAPIKL